MLKTVTARLFVLFALLAVTGCAAMAPQPISGSSTATFKLPLGHTVDEAKKTVSERVAALMYDDAAKSVRDAALAKIANDDVIPYPDNQETRVQLAEMAVNQELREIIKDRRANFFTMTRSLPSHRAAGEVFHLSISPKPTTQTGTFSGAMELGEDFNWYYQGHSKRDRESYTVDLSGSWNVSQTSLELTYTLVQSKHSSEIGLNSKFDMAAMASALHEVAQETIKDAVNDAENSYNKKVNSIVADISSTLKSRVVVAGTAKDSLGETTFNVGFETATARLQRRLDKFKYDKDNSTFVFEQSEAKDWFDRTVDEKVVLTVKLFPERTKTVAVYQVEYQPVHDKLVNRQLFAIGDARTVMAGSIKEIERLLRD